jgi:GntR family carbon starvation induced transcriptional regulator
VHEPLPPSNTVIAKTLADQVFQRIRADIVSGVLRPGSKLRLEALSQHYGVGMSPLREALTRLATDELAVSEGQRGFWVAPLSLAELDDVTHVRGLIEIEALQLSMQRGGPDWETDVRETFAALSEAETRFRRDDGQTALPSDQVAAQWEICNRRFHGALISACGSPWLMRLHHKLYLQSERYRRVSLVTSPASRCVHDEHVALFEAAVARNVLRACKITEMHLRNTANAVRDSLQKAENFSDVPGLPRTSTG